jgi:hypothetical protein
MSIETDHLSLARSEIRYAVIDLHHHIGRPLRRSALKLRADRLEATLWWERRCVDAEIERQQKLINRLQAKLREHEENAAVQDHRIAALEQDVDGVQWLLEQQPSTEQQHDHIADLAAD